MSEQTQKLGTGGEQAREQQKPETLGEGVASERFDKFSQRARHVLALAQEEAQRFNHNYIGTEHLLLGLVRESEGVAGKVLENLGVELTKVRKAVEFIIGRGDRAPIGEIGLTPRARKVVELAVDEARQMGHHYIGTEHLLLGLIREGEGIAAGVLRSLGVALDAVRQHTMAVLGGVREAVITCRVQARDLEAIDTLVEAGLRSTRSEAAAWLIRTGIEARRDVLEKVTATVAQIRQLRQEAQRVALETMQPTGDPPATPTEGQQEGGAAT